MNILEAHVKLFREPDYFTMASAIRVVKEWSKENDIRLTLSVSTSKENYMVDIKQGLRYIMRDIFIIIVHDNDELPTIEVLDDEEEDEDLSDVPDLGSYEGDVEMKSTVQGWFDGLPEPLFIHVDEGEKKEFNIMTMEGFVSTWEWKCENTMLTAAAFKLNGTLPSSGRTYTDDDHGTRKMKNWSFVSVWAGCGWEALEKLI